MGQVQTLSVSVEDAIAAALALVTDALERLDTAAAPADIGAHLDLALHRMRSVLDL